MNKEKVQEYLKELTRIGFNTPTYQEIVDQQRISIKEFYITDERINGLVNFCKTCNFTFDLRPIHHQNKEAIHIEIWEEDK